MANILFTWEMGGNLGHLANLRSLMQIASEQGHSLSVALRDMRSAHRVLAGLDFRCFQAPFRLTLNTRPTPQCLSYAHTLEDFCFSESDELAYRIKAWREIFDAARPEVVVYDSSPGALIASHGSNFGKIVTGNGFFLPLTVASDGVFAPFITTARDKNTMGTLRRNDLRLLGVLNGGCERVKLPRFESLGDIYAQADLAFYMTLPELDQFGTRYDTTYLGMQPSFGTARPSWPEGGADKVFCYLQNFAGVDTLLDELSAHGLKLLVYSRDLPAALPKRFRRVGNIAFNSQPVSLEAISHQARFVVHHTGHATAGQFFLRGVPQLCVPLQQEQLLTALQLDRAGVGVTALHNQSSFARDIRQIHQQASIQERARHFQLRYADFSWEHSEERIRSELEKLLAKIAR